MRQPQGSDLGKVNFSDTNLEEVPPGETNLDETVFKNTNLSGAHLVESR
jgi:uncharacterized protein YjbI with pentapeptide repeats